MTDQMRMPPGYESAELRAWRAASLPGLNSLAENGLSFTNNHVMTAACVPSRAAIFTGQYPSLHGVTQTSGAAKAAIEEDLYWLDPATVPTMGDWFRAAGYDTYYKGKWHVSDADLYQPGTHNTLPSYNEQGEPDPDLEDIYLRANQLDSFGFDGWIGPEPHGKSPLDSGSSAGPDQLGRDRGFADQAVAQLRALRRSCKPWLLVASFVGTHDTSLWGDLILAQRNFYLAEQLPGSSVPLRVFDDSFEASKSDPLTTKPSAQASYRSVLPQFLQPIRNGEPYHRFYYQLHANVDAQISRVLKALRADRQMARDTIVVFLSDHGELLGAHGLFEKWHQAYDETLRVPFVFHNPVLFPKARSLDVLTSNADLLPTMLGLAGADVPRLARRLARSHTQVRPLVGRDLSPLLLGERRAERYDTPQYFMTDDEISRGDNQVSALGNMYRPVAQPCHVETVIAKLPTGPDGALERWKYSRYWDNPQFWSTPGTQDVQTFIDGPLAQPGDHVATVTVKTAAVADEIEVYNLARDPLELANLAADPASASPVATLAELLVQQRTAKRLAPIPPW